MKKILCLLGGAMLLVNFTFAQFANYSPNSRMLPLYIGGQLPNIQFHKIINNKSASKTLSEFQGPNKKLVVFDFWNIYCTSCIQQFPHEIKMQKKFNDKLQIILITEDSTIKVQKLIDKWERKHNMKLNMPIITQDTILLKKYIRVFYNPQFAWIAPNNQLIAQTNATQFTTKIIRSTIKTIKSRARRKKRIKNKLIRKAAKKK